MANRSVIIFTSKYKLNLNSLQLAALTLVVGFSLSFFAYLDQKSRNQTAIEHELQEVAQATADNIITRLRRYEYGLRGTRGFVLAAGENNLTREKFHRFISARDLDKEFPGARGFGFIRRVPASAENKFIENARADAWPDFDIHQFSAHDGDLYVIQYVEPVARNRQAIGLDIASEKNRRAAAIESSVVGEAQLTAPITLVQADQKPLKSFLMLLPIYSDGASLQTREERVKATLGWIYAPLLMEEVLAGQLKDCSDCHISIKDLSEKENKVFFLLENRENENLYKYSEIINLDVYGRHWQIEVSAHTLFIEEMHLPLPSLWLVFGFMFSVVLAALVSLFVKNIHRERNEKLRMIDLNLELEAQVEERTRELEKSRKNLQKLLDAIPAMIGYWDKNLLNRFANKAYKDWFGVNPDSLYGTPMKQLLGDEIFNLNLPYINGVLTGEPQAFERSIPQANGNLRHSLAQYLPDITETGVKGFYVIVTDITQTLNARAELNRLNDLLKTVLRAASEVSIIATSPEGIIKVFNSGAEKMLGYSAEELVDQKTPAVLHDLNEIISRGEELSKEFDEKIEGFNVFIHKPQLFGSETRNWTYIKKDGERITVSLCATCMRDETGAIVGYLGIATDISEKLRQERELIAAKELADAASAAKSAFLANVSHEIRTPMNAVLGMLQLVQQTQLTERQKDYLVKAYSAGKSLLGLLNDVLDFSKIDAGKLQLEAEPFNLEELMCDLGIILSGNLNNKPVDLIFDIEPNLPKILIGDKLRIQQILINLAGNAIKFTHQGIVVVGLHFVEKNSNAIVLRVAVSDTGIGISDEQKSKIFDDFVQAENSTARRYGGTGLGLTISKNLIGLMGGNLQVESQLEHGSRFWFDISLPIYDAEPLVKTPTHIPPLRVLVVDTNVMAADVLALTTNALGWNAQTVNNSEAALELIRDADQRNEPYDLLIIDAQAEQPESQSLNLSKNFISLNRKNPLAVIWLVNAHNREIFTQSLSQESISNIELILKPVTPKQLVDSVERILSGAPLNPPQAALSHKAITPLKNIRILVVEDNALNRQVAFELLTAEGALVELAEGGLEGVEKVFQGVNDYDLVIMDMQMPDIDGLEATRRIRANSAYKNLPIMAMTANASSADRENCLAAGMNDHVGKPVDMSEVMPKILSLVGRKDLIDLQSFEKIGNEKLVEDYAEILKRFANNATMYSTLLTRFPAEVEKLFVTLQLETQQNNYQKVAIALHSLKGLSATLGAKALAARASALEKQVKASETAEEVRPLVIEELKDLFLRTMALLEKNADIDLS